MYFVYRTLYTFPLKLCYTLTNKIMYFYYNIRQARIRELEKRIKDLTAGMVERRRQPKGSPQQEMEIARREMEMVAVLFLLCDPFILLQYKVCIKNDASPLFLTTYFIKY